MPRSATGVAQPTIGGRMMTPISDARFVAEASSIAIAILTAGGCSTIFAVKGQQQLPIRIA